MIKYKTSEYTFGDIVYIKTDPMQQPHQLVGVTLRPSYKADDPAVPLFVLSTEGNQLEVFDFEVSKVRDLSLFQKPPGVDDEE